MKATKKPQEILNDVRHAEKEMAKVLATVDVGDRLTLAELAYCLEEMGKDLRTLSADPGTQT